MIAKIVCGAALAALLSSPALAQTMTLGKGQMLRVAPNGQVTIAPVPTDSKMQRMMHQGSKAMARGTVIYMDNSGMIHETGSSFIQSLRNAESDGTR
jgi:hypothetical protein